MTDYSSTQIPLCDPYFWEQPSILTGGAWWKRWVSTTTPCASEMVNEIAAVYLLTFAISIVISIYAEYAFSIPIALAVSTLYLIPVFIQLVSKKQKTEGFTTATPVSNIKQLLNNNYETEPTPSNPFMNVLITDITDNPTRPPAANIRTPKVQDSLDSFFRVQWTSDPTDVFGRTQSQREFITMPSTSIPNDAGSYQDWLYKIPGKTCKEGGREACLPGTDGAAVAWLNQD